MVVSRQLNYTKTRRFHAIFMPVIIEFSRCIGTYSSAKFEYNKKYTITEKSSEAEKLRHRIMNGKKSKDEWLQLRADVRSFFESDAPEKDKKMLSGYTETLVMICSAIEDYGYEP